MQQSILVKQKYQHALIENLKKDIILYNLTKQQSNQQFDEFNDVLSVETLQLLRSIGQTPECDSSFVLAAVRSLYGQNLPTLKNKSYSGISKDKKKEPFTPEKLNCLRSLYEKRFEYMEDNIIMHTERKKKFAKHIKTALETINNKVNK